MFAVCTAVRLAAGCSSPGSGGAALGVRCDTPIPTGEVAVLAGTEIDPAEFDLCDPNVRAGLIADLTYLRAVHAHQVPFPGDDVAMTVGRGMCELIERAVLNGYSVPDAKTALRQQSERANVYSTSDNAVIIAAAVDAYCPEYGPN